MAPHKNDISQLNIAFKSHGLALNKPRGHCNIGTALSIKSGKKLVFQFKFGLEKCLEVFT